MTGKSEFLLRQLRAASSIDRLHAARLLADRILSPTELSQVQAALADEVDAWVISALRGVISAHTTGMTPGAPVEALLPEDVGSPQPQALAEARARAVVEVTHRLVHEIRPILGVLEVEAAREIPEFDESRTSQRVKRLQGLLDTIEKLGDAARPPEPTEFDLTEAIYVASRDLSHDPRRPILARNEPVNSWGDWPLICLCFSNGLKNALEATATNDGAVIINWGTTDRDSWIAILDEGSGLPPGIDRLFEEGVTLKSRKTNHGWGLAIARQAISSAGGDLSLRPRHVGAAFEIRWPVREGRM